MASADTSLTHLKNVVDGRAEGREPLDLANVQPWHSWTRGMFECAYCGTKCDIAYETTFEWGDTKQYTHVPYMCSPCLSTVCKATRNAAESKYVVK